MRSESMQASVHEAHHGGIDTDELSRHGILPDHAIDFSSNIMPGGPSSRVRLALQTAVLDRYPDRDCRELRRAIADRYLISPERLLVGNGCSELIHWVAAAAIQTADEVLVIGPTFSEYERATRIAGGVVHRCDARAESGFAVPVGRVEAELAQGCFRVVWICNPNNPTGQSVPRQTLMRWARRYPDTVFVVDESYIEFAEQAESLLGTDVENLVVLRSMTKAYGIAGLRLGFAWLADSLLQAIRNRRVPWSVNSLAQAAGTAAVQDESHYAAALSRLRQAKRVFMSELASPAMTPLPSDAGFFLLRIDQADRVRERLLAGGMIVRDCHSFGLEGYLRIAVLDSCNNRRLVKALAKLAQGEAFIEECCSVPSTASKNECLPSVEAEWDEGFRHRLNRLFQLRRDVRRFRSEPVPAESMQRWLQAACLAPSVGLSQPWRFVSVRSPARRAAVIAEFEMQNQLAASRYDDVTADRYRALKLAGLREAPEQLAVFVEEEPSEGRGLGRSTMPETVDYSVVAAIQNFWLAARAEGVGVGWVSILRPQVIAESLNVPATWRLIAYLCIGYPMTGRDDVPELERAGWEQRHPWSETWHQR